MSIPFCMYKLKTQKQKAKDVMKTCLKHVFTSLCGIVFMSKIHKKHYPGD